MNPAEQALESIDRDVRDVISLITDDAGICNCIESLMTFRTSIDYSRYETVEQSLQSLRREISDIVPDGPNMDVSQIGESSAAYSAPRVVSG